MKIKVRNSPKVIHLCCKKFLYSSFPLYWAYHRDHITCYQSSLTGCNIIHSFRYWIFLKRTENAGWYMHAKCQPLSSHPRQELGRNMVTTIHCGVRGALNHYTTFGTDFRVMMILLSHFICKYWLCHLHAVWLVVSVSSRSLIYEQTLSTKLLFLITLYWELQVWLHGNCV